MPRMIFLVFLAVGLHLGVSACAPEVELDKVADPVPDQERPSAKQGLLLSLDKTKYTGTPEEMRVTLENQSTKDFTLGEFYQLEQKVDGLWYIVLYSNAVFYKNRDFKNYGLELRAGETIVQTYSPAELGITFPAGEYRLVKTVIHRDPSYEISIAVPFQVSG
ncbi:immunoglobulin-like domain-containing protein [Bacillus piscicola]|uniref:immunoglobulin-like domain-containing protein n=1 Tax=Bacillus piscicola TaxID=1632684 RepID=UPI001F093019|nr:immunoglobulin-like domain-containing protein [Bacillus piscicola]